MSIVIVAEAGVNHNGSIDLAIKLIDAASDSGADYVKFQTFDANRLVTKSAPKAEYQRTNSNDFESQLEMLRKLELSTSQLKDLISYADSRQIKLISTAFDQESADTLLDLGQTVFKIPSGEITNLPYLRHVGSFKREIYLSTGMSNMDEVIRAVEELINAGTPKTNITVLHCTSAYPAPLGDVNLRAIEEIRDVLDIDVGYSDHTIGIEVPIAAAALGATVIEKHFTIDKSLPGPDHKASLDKQELLHMVTVIRNIERALGDRSKRLSESEVSNRILIRKSIVAKVPISKGERLTTYNLTTKRPGTGISPLDWDQLIGTVAKKDYDVDEQIKQ